MTHRNAPPHISCLTIRMMIIMLIWMIIII
ncbi:hypothetical protein X566_11570 [Afipia sp. P52-10]|nr:hypothetical protein X566_11570 [Afipia sp. P52-10]